MARNPDADAAAVAGIAAVPTILDVVCRTTGMGFAAILLDSVRIGQLSSNLLSNAPTHGAADQPVRVRCTAQGGTLELRIANAGRPIPDAARARLFQPFFRGEVRRDQQGLGLGLFIASEIARAHGGTLDVCSNTRETRFTFSMKADAGRPRVGVAA